MWKQQKGSIAADFWETHNVYLLRKKVLWNDLYLETWWMLLREFPTEKLAKDKKKGEIDEYLWQFC